MTRAEWRAGRKALAQIREEAAARDARIVEEWRRRPGRSAQALARELGWSPQTVRNALHAAGISLVWGARPGNDNRAKARREEEIGELTPDGVAWAVAQYRSLQRSPARLARLLGVRTQTLCDAMRAAGVELGPDDPAVAARPAPGAAAAARMRRAAARYDSWHVAGAEMP